MSRCICKSLTAALEFFFKSVCMLRHYIIVYSNFIQTLFVLLNMEIDAALVPFTQRKYPYFAGRPGVTCTRCILTSTIRPNCSKVLQELMMVTEHATVKYNNRANSTVLINLWNYTLMYSLAELVIAFLNVDSIGLFLYGFQPIMLWCWLPH